MEEHVSTNDDPCLNEKDNKSFIFIRDKHYGRVPAELLKVEGNFATVIRKAPERSKKLSIDNDKDALFPDVDFKVGDDNSDLSNDDESVMNNNVQIVMNSVPMSPSLPSNTSISIISSCMDTQTLFGDNSEIMISTKEYSSGGFPLQCIDEDGNQLQHEDMCKMHYLHEASLLYNLKNRYEGKDGVPYTRAGGILIAINPYRWIKGLYAEKCRFLYANNLVWQGRPTALEELPPHLYEASSLAFKGLIFDGKNQSILVSGESGVRKKNCLSISINVSSYGIP